MNATINRSQCKACDLTFDVDVNGYCDYCAPGQAEKVRFYKQKLVFQHLNNRGLRGTQTDKLIDGGACGRERPDRIYEESDRFVIIEIDENQHKERPCECEQIRMVNVSNALGGKPVLWVRFNPDTYKTSDEVKVPLEMRLQYLEFVLNEARTKCALDAFIKVTYIYYDDWKTTDQHLWQILTYLTDETGIVYQPRLASTVNRLPIIQMDATEYLKTNTHLTEDFISDFCFMFEKDFDENKPCIDLDILAKWTGTIKSKLTQKLKNNYILNTNYTKTKVPRKNDTKYGGNNSNKIKISLLTLFNLCIHTLSRQTKIIFKDLCLMKEEMAKYNILSGH